jgi:hypothetical protein
LVFTASSFKRFQQSDLNKINQLRVRKIGSLLKYAANSGRRANVPQGSRDFYIRAERASLPPHTPDMLAVRIQVIDGARTFTLQDSQPCRLLPFHLLKTPDILCANDRPLAYIGNDSRTKRKKGEMSLRGVFD